MGTATNLEVEIKFSATEELAVPDLTHVSGCAAARETVVHRLSAVYFDTPDLRLTRAKVTLRRRTGGKDDGWHIKLPGEQGRLEIHADSDPADPERIPAEILATVRALSRGQSLEPIARVDNERHETVYEDAAGEALAEFCDDHVSARSFLPTGTARRWREWEIELAGPAAETKRGAKFLRKASKVVRAAGASDSDSPSKLVAALGESIAAAPTPPQLAELPSSSPAAGVVAALAQNRDRIVEMDPRVRRDEWDSIHQMRVATRELRSHMRTFEGILVGEAYGHIEQELKALAGILGQARDAEVVAERMAHLIEAEDSGMIDETTRTRVLQGLHRDYRRAHARVVKVLDSERYLTLLRDLDELLAHPPLADDAHEAGDTAAAAEPEQVLASHLDDAYRRLVKRHKKAVALWADQELDLHTRENAVHNMRKAAKKLRYSADAAGAATSLKTKKVVKACKRMQSVLGDFQDTVTSRDMIVRLALRARAKGEDTFAYGLLYQKERQLGLQALSGYEESFDAIRAAYTKMRGRRR
ncbi:CYTH and CHAD domain-containing protein [Corynebacterium sp. TAE3-ERU2]|uniref:CYTH and CHAD domain-containing protein n=1 Tax=Corynebacterium sp. TAE3-ERU2 TaxID=2849497 RepID=UPI001C46F830|nr:CYTH and CHAD domain-containing protein [Corynebacterium sp. TAE3-ERU2]MBV7301367.1 CYTH and CHAD domain-containing protein [Corynebacterium sp. TAE3-ERU2]